MKKVFVTAIIIIGFAAAALGLGFFFTTGVLNALYIGLAGLVLALGLYIYDGVVTYNEMHGKKGGKGKGKGKR